LKKLVYGGKLYDGTGRPAYQADILIQDGRIAAVEPGLLARGLDAEPIDATGYAVTPGFIDMHRHCDVAPLRDKDYGTLELNQGIVATTVGNCGIACVPVLPEHYREYSSFISPVVGNTSEKDAFETYGAYFSALRTARPAIHMGVLAGTGAVKVAVKGFADTPYTAKEMEKAQALVASAMAEGALGVSLGFMYMPEYYTTPQEQAKVIAPAAASGGLLTTHIRGEGDSLVSSVREVITIARQAGIRLHISHFKATGIRNWNKSIHQAIALIEDARAAGDQVTADFYPYAGGSTTIFSLIPPSVMRKNNEATLAYLATPAGKEALRTEIAREHAGWDNMALSIGWDRILIAGTQLVEHAAYSGKSVAALAEQEGYHDASDFVCDLVVSESGGVGIVVMSMDENDVDTVAKLPYTAVISDALYGGGGNPHPRLYGAFPRLIHDFVFKRGVLSFETAIHKMTGLPADILGLRDRGKLECGCHADLNIFDPLALQDHARYEDSRQMSTGMNRVLMDGETVYRDGHVLNNHFGQVLKRLT